MKTNGGINTGINTEMDGFELFCRVDLQLTDATTRDHAFHIRRFRNVVDKPLDVITKDDIRKYMSRYNNRNPSTYRNHLSSLRRFFRDYLRRSDVVEGFRMPRRIFALKQIPDRNALRLFYSELGPRERALFLLLSTTGLRISEALGLTCGNIDFHNRMVVPNSHQGITKKSWVTFYNPECEESLREYIAQSEPDSELFPISRRHIERLFKETGRKVGHRITPQTLRAWFCSEMGRLGVADRFIDAFCGRVPASVLAKHYTSYSPQVLKEIYDKANLKVLS